MHARWLLVGALLLVGCNCSGGSGGEPTEPQPVEKKASAEEEGAQHLEICYAALPETLDPARATSLAALPIVTELFDGLAAWDERGHPVPSLAERWEAAKGQRVWTFHLREGARWSNGREIAAEDFVYHVARVLHPGTRSRNLESFFGIQGAREYHEALEEAGAGDADPKELDLPPSVGVRALDPRTLVLEFEEPTPWAPHLAASHFLRPAPREAVQGWRGAWASSEDLVTSGPFRLVDFGDDRIVLERSKTFWDRDAVELRRVTFHVVPRDRALEAYRAGECDVTTNNLVPADVGGAEGLEQHPHLGVYFILLNSERLSNRHLRRALALAVDRSKLPLAGQPTTSFTPAMAPERWTEEERRGCGELEVERVLVTRSGGLCYRPPPGLGGDPAAAARELETAKEELGEAFPERLTVSFNDVEKHRAIAEQLAAQWREHLGLEVRLREQEWRRFLKDTMEGSYEIARMAWIGAIPDPLGDFLPMLRCEDPQNRSNWCNEEFEGLVEEALAEEDPEERLKLARRAEALVLSEAPVIPLYVYRSQRLRRDRVRGMAQNLTGRRSLRWVSLAEK